MKPNWRHWEFFEWCFAVFCGLVMLLLAAGVVAAWRGALS